ncbi:MAG: outer membrane beta-barrel protein [Gammaproteobacteria bacterium]|nr:outer membrane beta-barrel protein [Gammaproteobacteria bacterium]
MARIRTTRLRPAAAALALLGVGPALALDVVAPPASSTTRNFEPAQFADEAEDLLSGFYPSVTVSATRDTNVLKESANEESDWVYTIAPGLEYRTELGRHSLSVGYQGVYQRYGDLSSEDGDNHYLGAALGLDITNILDVNLGARYADVREARGRPGTRNFALEPDRYQETSYDGEAVLGRREATLQLAAAVGVSEMRYQNNDQQGRDRDSQYFSVTGYWNTGPRSSLFGSVTWEEIDYVESAPINLDSDVTTYSVGGIWQMSEKTSAKVSVGQQKKDLLDPAANDYNGTVYEARLRWAPRSYSQFEVYAGRSTEETTDVSNGAGFIESDILGADWNHELNDRWSLNAGARYISDDFSDGRQDELSSYSAGVNYGVNDWLSVGASYGYAKRTSNLEGADYEGEIIVLSVTGSR